MAWPTMPSNALPVVDYTVSVTIGANTASFTFRVSKHPVTTRSIANFGLTTDRYTLSFLVKDVTNYEATGNPRAKFTTSLSDAIIKGLRTLVNTAGTIIPPPGSSVTFGATTSSVVESIDVAQVSDRASDTFMLTCNIREPSTAASSVSDDDLPKVARSEEIPPWQRPADVQFEANTTEGLTLGFAFPTHDLDGTKTYTFDQLRESGILTDAKMVSVENYAGDPFSSPPAMPKVNGTLRITKGFLRGAAEFDMEILRGVVNEDTISVSSVGAKVFFPAGTLSPAGLSVVPKIYECEVPWYPKTKHPLNKTYGELFYGYSRKTANRIAVNKTDQVVLVKKPSRYVEVSVSLTYRIEGFGTWVANRGYGEKDKNAPDGLSPVHDDRGLMKEVWLDANGLKTKTKKIWRGFTMMDSTAEVENLFSLLFPTTEDDVIPWATRADNYGARI